MTLDERYELNQEFIEALKNGTNNDLVLAGLFAYSIETDTEVKDSVLKVKLATFLKKRGF